MKTRKEILLETAGAYTSETRSYLAGGGCQYLTPDGKRCAFSRCCKDDKETLEILAQNEGSTAESLMLRYGQTLLKPEYQGHSPEFWSRLQMLHDQSFHWDENGLTVMGKQELSRLIGKYGRE